jgi:hypothetical protein
MASDPTRTTIRSNEAAAREIASEIRRRFGFEMNNPMCVRWLALCIGEVRAEVVEPESPSHTVLIRWSESDV